MSPSSQWPTSGFMSMVRNSDGRVAPAQTNREPPCSVGLRSKRQRAKGGSRLQLGGGSGRSPPPHCLAMQLALERPPGFLRPGQKTSWPGCLYSAGGLSGVDEEKPCSAAEDRKEPLATMGAPEAPVGPAWGRNVHIWMQLANQPLWGRKCCGQMLGEAGEWGCA